MVEIQGYSADCRFSGRVELADRRLTDELNATLELHLTDARLESLDDGHLVELPELTVGREELFAVVASGPRGDETRRLHTHAIAVETDLGPYHVTGAVHGTPASDPLGAVVRRAPWVPLTEATITYRSGDGLISEELDTLLVNRGLASSFRTVEEAIVALPWETPRTTMTAKVRSIDLTGTLHDEVGPKETEQGSTQAAEPPV